MKVFHRQDFIMCGRILEDDDRLLCFDERNVTSHIVGNRKRADDAKNSSHRDNTIVMKLYIVELKVSIIVKGWRLYKVDE